MHCRRGRPAAAAAAGPAARFTCDAMQRVGIQHWIKQVPGLVVGQHGRLQLRQAVGQGPQLNRQQTARISSAPHHGSGTGCPTRAHMQPTRDLVAPLATLGGAQRLAVPPPQSQAGQMHGQADQAPTMQAAPKPQEISHWEQAVTCPLATKQRCETAHKHIGQTQRRTRLRKRLLRLGGCGAWGRWYCPLCRCTAANCADSLKLRCRPA